MMQEYRIPAYCSRFLPIIKQIAQIESDINPSAIDYYCYLTIDQGIIPFGQTQRNQGTDIDKKIDIACK